MAVWLLVEVGICVIRGQFLELGMLLFGLMLCSLFLIPIPFFQELSVTEGRAKLEYFD
jgi:hypothetical protein